jgi:transposase-like protein
MPAKKQTANHNTLHGLVKAFPDEESCISHLENLRWPTGIVCPRCGSTRKIHHLARGNYKCSDCRNQFSVRKGTIFEESRLPLRKWFMAVWLVTNNRKGISSYQLAREIDVTQKTAWFMFGRLREVAAAMGATGGTFGGTVEVDETYIGGKAKNMHAGVRKEKVQGRGAVGKAAVVTIVERDGRVRSQHVSTVHKKTC